MDAQASIYKFFVWEIKFQLEPTADLFFLVITPECFLDRGLEAGSPSQVIRRRHASIFFAGRKRLIFWDDYFWVTRDSPSVWVAG